MTPRWARRVVLVGASLFVAAVVVELATWATFRWPLAWRGRAPERVERQLLRYHAGFLAAAPIQLRPECAEPDPELLYRLRPGTCRFDGDEFDTTVRVSRRHLREDDELSAAELVVLGDSFALGWGVEREQAFPALAAADLGARAVVAAGSSYGTVRELLLLRRLALADFAQVVIQYHANDLRENRAFAAAGRHRPAPPAEYQRWVEITRRIHEKVVLRRARHWFALAWSDLAGAPPPIEPPAGPAEHARLLLVVLEAFASDLRGRPVLVLSEGLGPDESRFVAALQTAPPAPGLGPIRAIDVGSHLGPGHTFALDPHWNVAGHAVAASRVAAELRRWHVAGR
ncbi:MAG: hypothetical protein KJ067_02725 [Vicinamibacteria bacterium]|nr:hypothetical protein [Vicinamibacteria bacterium]